MPTLSHKSYLISVEADRARFKREYFVPKVKIATEDATPRVKLTPSQEFPAESDAVAYGFEIAKKWIETRQT